MNSAAPLRLPMDAPFSAEADPALFIACAAQGASAKLLWTGPPPSTGEEKLRVAEALQSVFESARAAATQEMALAGPSGAALTPMQMFNTDYRYDGETSLTATPNRRAIMAMLRHETPSTLTESFSLIRRVFPRQRVSPFTRLWGRAVDAMSSKEALAESMERQFELTLVPAAAGRISRHFASRASQLLLSRQMEATIVGTRQAAATGSGVWVAPTSGPKP